MLMPFVCDEKIQMWHSNFENENLFQTRGDNLKVLGELVA
jgi:hypothetical protein